MQPFWHLPSFSFAESKALFRFGKDITLVRLLWFFYIQADVFIAGKLLGKEVLGLYSVAMHIAALPVERLSLVVNQVALAAFSQANRTAGQVGHHMLKAARTMSFIAFPLLWGIASVSDELIKVFLGKAWEGTIPLLSLLCLVMPLRMIGEVMKSALQSVGRTDAAVRNALVAALVMPASFLVGIQFGLLGLALAWVFMYPLVFLENIVRSAPLLGLRPIALLSAMARPALISAAMFGAVGAIGHSFALSPAPALAVHVAIGAAVYSGLSLLVNRKNARETWDLIGVAR
jgi:O-antigen/teichoic acid export membrane protein